MYFTQSTIELGAQEVRPIKFNVLSRWLKMTCLKIIKEAELVIPIGESFHNNEAFMK